MHEHIDNSLDSLDPTFRASVDVLLQRLQQRGLGPLVFETHRSFERAAELSKTGTGVRRSMHCYGLAVDIIDRELHWDAPDDFWSALGAEAHILGLTWGGDWRREGHYRAHDEQFLKPLWDWPEDEGRDKPHVQAVPISLQRHVRRASTEEIARLVGYQLGAPAPSGVA